MGMLQSNRQNKLTGFKGLRTLSAWRRGAGNDKNNKNKYNKGVNT